MSKLKSNATATAVKSSPQKCAETLLLNEAHPQPSAIYTYSPSTTSLSDLTAAHKNFQLNQRLKNLRRSFNSNNNNNNNNHKKVKCLNDKSSLSYMASSTDLHKLKEENGSEHHHHDYMSLTRKPSESNLLLFNNIDLNTHHEKSGGFLFFSTKRKIQNQDLMIWTSQTIQKPLIKTSNKVIKKEACDLFKLIQMYMGDRKIVVDLKQYASKAIDLKSCSATTSFTDEHSATFLDQLGLNLAQRDLVCLDIMTKGWLHAQLRDELYLQIIKQTTSNVNRQSDLFGWQLLAICLSFFPPTHKLYPFLSEYILAQNAYNNQVGKNLKKKNIFKLYNNRWLRLASVFFLYIKTRNKSLTL